MNLRMRPLGGFTLVEIMIVIAIIGLLAGVGVPNYLRMQENAKREVCNCNREAIDNAKTLWAAEHKKSETDVPGDEDLKNYLKKNQIPACPSGGGYTIGAVNAPVSCSKHGDGSAK